MGATYILPLFDVEQIVARRGEYNIHRVGNCVPPRLKVLPGECLPRRQWLPAEESRDVY